MHKSPVTWFGGKYYIADKLISLMPGTKCYVEVFGGSAQILFRKAPAPVEIYNDIFGEVVNFFKVIKLDPKKVFEEASSLPYARQLFEEFKWNDPSEMNNLDRAVRWFYLNRGGYSGERRTKTGWSSSKRKIVPSHIRIVAKKLWQQRKGLNLFK